NFRVVAGDVAGAAQEEAVGKLHDVRLMNAVNALALMFARVFKGEAGDARGSLGGDDLQALDDAGHDLVLDAGVKAFGVFANDDEVDVGITRRNVRKISYGP